MNENPNTQSPNNDLDNLLQEFQSLSATPEEPKKEETTPVNTEGTEPSTVAANPSVEATPEVVATPQDVTTPAPEVASDVTPAAPTVPTTPQAEPVTPAPVQPETAPVTPTVPSQEPVSNPTPVTPTVSEPQGAPATPAATTTTQASPVTPTPVATAQPATNVAPTSEVTPTPGADNGNTGVPGTETPMTPSNDSNKSGGKGNLVFIIVILLIVGIFIFFMPKINEIFDKKPGKESKPTPTPTAPATVTSTPNLESKITCTEPETTVSETQKNQNLYRIHYENNKVTKVEKIFKNIYADTVDTTDTNYVSTQNTCGSLSTTYANITGYSVVCEEKDKTFTVTYAFDLESFVNPTQITINGNTEEIKSDIKYGDDIETLKANLEGQGMTCK